MRLPELRRELGQDRDGGEQLDVAHSRVAVRVIAETCRHRKGRDVDVRVEDDTHSSVLEHQALHIALGPHTTLAAPLPGRLGSA